MSRTFAVAVSRCSFTASRSWVTGDYDPTRRIKLLKSLIATRPCAQACYAGHKASSGELPHGRFDFAQTTAGGTHRRRDRPGSTGAVRASDHLDTPTVAMNPRADIGDLYAWTSPDGKQLNLVMTIVAQSFSENVEYTFHVDNGKRVGVTTATTAIVCRFGADQSAHCRADGTGQLRVFAGKRDDPFFNNVKGTRQPISALLQRCATGSRRTQPAARASMRRRRRQSSPSGSTRMAARRATSSKDGHRRRSSCRSTSISLRSKGRCWASGPPPPRRTDSSIASAVR